MAELIADCPRCGVRRITFDLTASCVVGARSPLERSYETFCICRHCRQATIFRLIEDLRYYQEVRSKGVTKLEGVVNRYLDIEKYVTLKDQATVAPPEHVPEPIAEIFNEGATCLAVGCYNAAGTMFRLCLDLATRSVLPNDAEGGPNPKVRRDLGLRLPWLFDNGFLPAELKELSSCIREDGNDGAHAGTLRQLEAEDLLDFAVALLERMYTEPERLRLAQERREARRGQGQ